jgi:CO/xanthine dehydrogenase Mo-binding subunit
MRGGHAPRSVSVVIPVRNGESNIVDLVARVRAQLVAGVFDVDLDRVNVVTGDTSTLPEAVGSFASRSHSLRVRPRLGPRKQWRRKRG